MNDEPKGSLLERIAKANREGGPGLILKRAANLFLQPWHDSRAQRQNLLVLLRRRLLARPVIHVMGDSHSQVLTGVSPFVVTWLGPATAFNAASSGSSTNSNEKITHALRRVNKKRDVVLLILGEIDTRLHIYYQHMKRGQHESMVQLIDKTISRYGEFALGLQREGYRVVVHSVPAAPYWDDAFDYPYYADDETRAWIVGEYNSRLSAWCAANGVEYLDMYKYAADDRGFIRKELTTDMIHLDESALQIYLEWAKHVVAPKGTQ